MLEVLDDNYQTWKFNGTFRDNSPYKGPPNVDVDKAWAEESQVDMGEGWRGYLEKPGGAVALEDPP